MLRLFQNIRPFSAIYVLLAGLALRIPVLIYGPGEDYSFDPAIMRGFFYWVNQNYMLSVLAGLAIIYIQSILFNRLCIQHDVIYAHSYLPAYFYMVINSVFPQNLVFNPVMLISFCVLLAFIFLYQLYMGQNSAILLYYAALFMGLASLLFPVFYFGIVFLIAGTIIFKNITIKDLLGIISGYVFAGIAAAGIFYLMGVQYRFPSLSYKLDLSFGSSPDAYFAVSVILFITIAGMIKTFINYSKNNIKTRRITLLMVAYLFFSLVIVLLNLHDFRLFFPIMSCSLSIQLAYFLIGTKQRNLKELLNYVVLLTVLFSLYGRYLNL